MRVLVVNTGSSSIKLRLLDHDDGVLSSADLAAGPLGREAEQVRAAVERMPRPDAVGHRVVHGGRSFTGPVRIDDGVLERLRELTSLAPLHQPLSLAGIGEMSRALPGVPAVACFDTAFHTALPAAAATYAIPLEWREKYGLRRYGFHGLSHAYASRRAAELTGGSRTVVAHLGSGVSLAAVRDGRSVDTTMGFTPLEGPVMATRSGTVDPGMLLWLADQAGISVPELSEALEHRSGLLALAGTADMREVRDRDDPAARLALDVYAHRLRAAIAAMAAAMNGLDTLVFTAGVGEHSHALRKVVTDGLAFLGVAVDEELNAAAGGTADVEIGRPGTAVRTLVIPAREDLEIAGQVRAVLPADSS